MSKLKKELLIDVDDARAVGQSAIFDDIRITVLTDRMIRIEVDGERTFEDAPTEKIWHRAFEKSDYNVIENSKFIIVTTKSASFKIDKNKRKLKSVKLLGGEVVTNFKKGNLKGTCRTLGGTRGRRKLEDGIISRSGVAILDDSSSLTYDGYGEIREREHDTLDIYVFAYGNKYREAVRDLYRLTGEAPLIPRFALGNWWSRYKAYTQEEYLSLMDDFITKDIPITVATVDMDWHLVENIPKKYRTKEMNPWDATGWTGYTWNKELFPDYKKFLKELHDRNLRVTLNLHPAHGVRAYEDMYMDMALELGVDYRNEDPVRFDLTDPEFVNAYFSILHHPYEKDGVDFWWIDWQQGNKTNLRGLDPLYVLNHYHYLDNARGVKRGLILSRYAGIGSHRYPLGFSGDTTTNWKCLKFQPYFTATSSNVGYTWWSHDIGGHMGGAKDDELYARWIQLGVFSPIMRLHSTSNDIMGKEPWNYSKPIERIAEGYLRFRHSLIPYIYTMNMRTHKDGLALIEPLYYTNPDDERAYRFKNEFMFGSELLVAPITSPTDRRTLTAPVKVFLPKGRWTDIFTGQVYNGNTVVEMNRGIDNIPVLAKEGAIIPLAEQGKILSSVDNPETMRLLVYKGTGEFTLYEDDGETYEYRNGRFATRKFAIDNSHDRMSFTIFPTEGDINVTPEKRKYIVTFSDIIRYVRAEIRINDSVIASELSAKNGVIEYEAELLPTDKLIIKLIGAVTRGNGKLSENIMRIFSRYQYSNIIKTQLYKEFKGVESPALLKSKIEDFTIGNAHRRLCSQLKELLGMEFDIKRSK